ncbi:vacuolar protein sorting-associated protein 55 [[Candida] railenensis]|uniref:Vacuolar protein sorting-associated protein 55 n=1 Tax=[Candida] railenensis TaxID=45579 RepID=A0A9P0QQT5_9ASCO|nr:vacuolar protein sorting-associated protein 55 [[Candida] railenensis]
MNSTTSFKLNPLNKIIGLSIVLSMGFLLVVLAGIYGNWFPIIIGIVFAFAHIPIIVSNVLSEGYGDYDFNFDTTSSNSPNAAKEVGLFLSAFLLISALSLPVLLHHSRILTTTAMVLTIIGGGLIYGTVYTFSSFFRDEEEEELEDIGGGVI